MESALIISQRTLRLSAKCWGNPKGFPILAFHGWLDNAATFDHLAPYLNGFRLVSLDLPGHGFSDHRSFGSCYHFSDLMVDILEVLDVLGWQHFSLLGHSMGAGVASYIAGIIPEKISSVILIEGLGSLTKEDKEMPKILIESANEWKNIDKKKQELKQEI